MNGSAYRTNIVPSVYTTESDSAAVYAIWPPKKYYYGRHATTLLLVSSSALVGDTVVHPCTPAGEIEWELVAHVPVQSHRQALATAGYDLELVVPRGVA